MSLTWIFFYEKEEKGYLHIMKKRRILFMAAAVAMLAGCQKNPDSSIVVNKDMDKLIDQANETGKGMENIADNYETYQTQISDTSLMVTVNVDASVDIPEVDKMSVFRVQQAPVTQEMLDKVIEVLIGNETLYNGGIVLETRTKADIEKEIGEWKSYLENLNPEEADEQLRKEYQSTISRLQEEYENAPSEIVWEGNESDGKLHKAEELNSRYSGNSFYEWEYSFNPNGEFFYGVTDGKNGACTSLTVQNNENYGNYIRYRKSKHGYEFTSSAIAETDGLEGGSGLIWEAGTEWNNPAVDIGDGTNFVEYTDESTTISEEDAIALSEDFLKKTGLSDNFKYDAGGLYNECLDIRKGESADKIGYRKEWILRYSRNINGVSVTFDNTAKHEEGWEGNDYVKRYWPIECIEFRITDEGIVGFDYAAPLTIIETVVENSNMKSFDEVKNIFEKMVTIVNAEDSIAENSQGTEIQIDRVVLGYVRVSEADSYNTGLLVPVWDFMGEIKDSYGVENQGSILAINAIDGSVIDRTLGY